MANEKQMAFAKKVYQAAKGGEIHPLFVRAQAMLETNWGANNLGENNIFGITKGSSWTGKVDMIQTTEYFSNNRKTLNAPDKVLRRIPLSVNRWQYIVIRAFRHYETLEDCLKDHVEILKKPLYKEAWGFRDNPFIFALMVTNKLRSKYLISPAYYTNLRAILITLSSKEEWLKEDEQEG